MLKKILLEKDNLSSLIYFKDSQNMEEIKDEQIMLILTSPPYFNLKDYSSIEAQNGQLPHSPEIYHQTYDEYLEMLTNVFRECFRVLSKNGVFLLNIDIIRIKTDEDKNIIPLPFNAITICNEIGFGCKDIMIYKKMTGVPFQLGKKLKDRYEYLIFFTKDNNYKWNLDDVRIPYPKDYIYPEGHKRRNPIGEAPSNVWEFYPPFQSGGEHHYHYCPFPYGLVDRSIKLFTDKGDWVLDPFLGSGQVLARAKFLKRNGIGYEINEDYYKQISNKIQKTEVGSEDEILRHVDYLEEKNEETFNKFNKKIFQKKNKKIHDYL